jgi:3-isopropylmalate/(R)-2-methylmalate dehydratase small subunit
MTMITGKVWKYGDHVNTDLIIPGRYLDDYTPQHLANHVMEDIDPSFAQQVQKGDIIVAGRNFGCGSSREQAPLALKYAGVGAVVAGSAARIFYRNAINVGLPILICAEASRITATGDRIEIDMAKGSIKNLRDGKVARFVSPPEFLLDILQSGGLVPYMRKKLDPASTP